MRPFHPSAPFDSSRNSPTSYEGYFHIHSEYMRACMGDNPQATYNSGAQSCHHDNLNAFRFSFFFSALGVDPTNATGFEAMPPLSFCPRRAEQKIQYLKVLALELSIHASALVCRGWRSRCSWANQPSMLVRSVLKVASILQSNLYYC